MPKIACCIPVKGRHPLLELTIKRLLKKNKATMVICSGDDQVDKAVAVRAGAEWVNCDNYPLSRKWNRAFFAASFHDPDYYVYVGSSDWLCDNWIEKSIQFMKDNKVDMVGKKDFYLLDNGYEGVKRVCHWPGYGPGPRENETIGIGRVISAEAMFKMNYAPFDPNMNNSLDWSMQRRLGIVKADVGIMDDTSMISLSVSDHRWKNMHKFEDHWNDIMPSDKMPQPTNWIKENFPEAMEL